MSKQDVILIGAGGFAREVLAITEACNKSEPLYNVLGYVVDREYFTDNITISGKPIISDIEFALDNFTDKNFICCIADIKSRLRLINKFEERGCIFLSVIHPSVIFLGSNTIGSGTVISAGAVISDNVAIGNHVLINLGAKIGHDVGIGDYSIISPGAHLSGYTTIGKGCIVGTGANIIERKSVGDWAVIGAGSTVFDNVPENSVVLGNPARTMKIKEKGWENRYEK